MRKILLVSTCAAVLSSQAALAQFWSQELKVDLSPKDPKYNSAACKSMRAKAKAYSDGTLTESAGSFVLGAGVPGGGAAVFAAQARKRELVVQQVEKACMTNPPNRAYLDPGATIGR